MSRAIDADALFREMEKAQWYNNADRDEIAEELVLNAPTIEPERKNGRWVNEQMDYGECSECGFYGMTTDFCPNCGAEMTKEQKRCDTCKHEREPWSNGCADCFDYELWEGKTDDQD